MSVEITDQDLVEKFDDSIQTMQKAVKDELSIAIEFNIIILVAIAILGCLGYVSMLIDSRIEIQENILFLLYTGLLGGYFLKFIYPKIGDSMREINKLHGETLMSSVKTLQYIQQRRNENDR